MLETLLGTMMSNPAVQDAVQNIVQRLELLDQIVRRLEVIDRRLGAIENALTGEEFEADV